MHRNWPCQVIESYLVRPIAEKPGVKLTGFPQSGRGDRSLFCDLYDRCLNLAAAQDWESFNCQNCSYENKGKISFNCAAFNDIAFNEPEPDEPFYLCSEELIDRLILNRANQEDLLIMMIDGDAHDDK